MRINLETSDKNTYKKIQLENTFKENQETFLQQINYLSSLAESTTEKQVQWQRANKHWPNKTAISKVNSY